MTSDILEYPNTFAVGELAAKQIEKDRLDAARYRFLMANAVGMAPESRDGPPHPVLEFYADIFNERPHQTPQFRITRKIDLAMKEPA